MHASFTGRLSSINPKKATKKIILNGDLIKSLLRGVDLILIPSKVKTPDMMAKKGIIDILRKLNLTSKAKIVFNEGRKLRGHKKIEKRTIQYSWVQ